MFLRTADSPQGEFGMVVGGFHSYPKHVCVGGNAEPRNVHHKGRKGTKGSCRTFQASVHLEGC